MAARSPRTRALLSLLSAHRELTLVELAELKQNVFGALVWGTLAVLSGLAAWIGINVAVVLAFRQQPIVAIGGVIGANLLVAVVGLLRVRALLRRPVLPLTRTETVRDVRAVMETVL